MIRRYNATIDTDDIVNALFEKKTEAIIENGQLMQRWLAAEKVGRHEIDKGIAANAAKMETLTEVISLVLTLSE